MNKTISTRIDTKVHKKVAKYCKANGINIRFFISKAVKEKLDANLVEGEQDG